MPQLTSIAGQQPEPAYGRPQEFGPGDACVIPGGFVGIFEVLEPVRKHYVVLEGQT